MEKLKDLKELEKLKPYALQQSIQPKCYWQLLLSAKWTLVLDFAVICHV